MKRQFLQIIFKGFLLLLINPFSFPIETFAQSSVSGKVNDSKNEPIPGVSVRVKGTTIGVTTDVNGEFKIGAAASQGFLVFSSIGYTTLEIQIDSRKTYEVILAEDNKFLNEIVVTALGIKREEKSLGFAAQTINAKAVVDAKTNNWINSLSGKVAGLNIQGTGAGPYATKIQCPRAESSTFTS